MAEDFALFGMTEEAEQYAQREAPSYELWHDNQATYDVFIALASQWRVLVGMASLHYQGICYTAIESTVKLMGIKRKRWPKLFAELRMMEAAALKVFREKEASSG